MPKGNVSPRHVASSGPLESLTVPLVLVQALERGGGRGQCRLVRDGSAEKRYVSVRPRGLRGGGRTLRSIQRPQHEAGSRTATPTFASYTLQ